MFEIKEFFQNKGFKISSFSGETYASNGIIKYLVISPHKGNDFKWTLRIATCAAFDRRANSSSIEKFFNTEQELNDYVVNNQFEIYKTLLEYLSEDYWDLQNMIMKKQSMSHYLFKKD